MDEQLRDAAAALQSILSKRLNDHIRFLKKYIPDGYMIVCGPLKLIPPNYSFKPGNQPIYMKDALSGHAFMCCGLLPNDHRRATRIIADVEWEMKVEDWLKNASRYEILRFSSYGAKSLQLLIDVLKWHGFNTTNLEQ